MSAGPLFVDDGQLLYSQMRHSSEANEGLMSFGMGPQSSPDAARRKDDFLQRDPGPGLVVSLSTMRQPVQYHRGPISTVGGRVLDANGEDDEDDSRHGSRRDYAQREGELLPADLSPRSAQTTELERNRDDDHSGDSLHHSHYSQQPQQQRRPNDHDDDDDDDDADGGDDDANNPQQPLQLTVNHHYAPEDPNGHSADGGPTREQDEVLSDPDCTTEKLSEEQLAKLTTGSVPLTERTSVCAQLGFRTTAKDHGHVGGLLAGKIGANRFVADYAVDSRSKCRDAKCNAYIMQQDLRIGKIPPSIKTGHSYRTHWYHLPCIFRSFQRSCKGTKTITSVHDIENFDRLRPADQRDILACIDQFSAHKSGDKPHHLKVPFLHPDLHPDRTSAASASNGAGALLSVSSSSSSASSSQQQQQQQHGGQVPPAPAPSSNGSDPLLHAILRDDPSNSNNSLSGILSAISAAPAADQLYPAMQPRVVDTFAAQASRSSAQMQMPPPAQTHATNGVLLTSHSTRQQQPQQRGTIALTHPQETLSYSRGRSGSEEDERRRSSVFGHGGYQTPWQSTQQQQQQQPAAKKQRKLEASTSSVSEQEVECISGLTMMNWNNATNRTENWRPGGFSSDTHTTVLTPPPVQFSSAPVVPPPLALVRQDDDDCPPGWRQRGTNCEVLYSDKWHRGRVLRYDYDAGACLIKIRDDVVVPVDLQLEKHRVCWEPGKFTSHSHFA